MVQTPDSILFKKILELYTTFLQERATTWETSTFYNTAISIINSLKVVNDAAEHGLKLGYDFIDSAKSEEVYQEVLQVMENDRKRNPNHRNTKQKSKT